MCFSRLVTLRLPELSGQNESECVREKSRRMGWWWGGVGEESEYSEYKQFAHSYDEN